MKGKTILLAANDDVFKSMCNETLTKAGFETIVARGEKNTIQHLSSNDVKIDLIILDIETPQINGLKILEWVKENHLERTLPVLVITESYESGNVMANLKHLGAAGLSTRSITPDHLIYRVNNLLLNEGSLKRIAQRVPATIRVDFRSGDTDAAGFILNISETGLFINYTSENLKTEDTLNLTFPLPSDDNAIEAEGKVVWLNKSDGDSDTTFKGFGIHFTKIKPDDRKKIAIFVKRELEMLG